MEWIISIFDSVKVFWGFAIAFFTYLLFPDQAFETSAMAVGIAIILDILTRWYAICKKSGGYRKAIITKRLYSRTLWQGTKVKLVSYAVIMVLAGLSYRVAPLEQMSVFLATIIYSVIFLREAQSNIENLIEAGADLHWLLFWVKRKQDEILEVEQEDNDDYYD